MKALFFTSTVITIVIFIAILFTFPIIADIGFVSILALVIYRLFLTIFKK